ncbi:thymidylate synthase [Elizabethkingia ursingii]|uniref:thymidylate synthase n=1 Tax=Elizabethkingia ursingii TaxID=1756150 RepID=UPI002011206E|nr:thymidylate synthase [Elizabethkingia ursingii]MCL1673003.1 thymidylate synthase [Elizabethkingia ursingii]
MFIEKNSLDDIISEVLKKIRKDGIEQTNSKGPNKELLGVYIKLTNPLNRISTSFSKSVFVSPIGEFLWYMSGSNKLDFIEYYIKKYRDFSNNKESLNGAYGARLFNNENDFSGQVKNVIELLKKKENTRQAVIQIFDKNDLLISKNLDIPCTCTLQFFIRDNKLVLFVTMRSNDVFVGLPHDIFCFTMLQEVIAKELKKEVGDYHHFIGSCHYYIKDDKQVNFYLSEGLQTTKTQMQPMPNNTSLDTIRVVLDCESKIRNNEEFDIENLGLDSYWKDLLYILLIYSIKKEVKKIKEFQEKISDLLHLINNKNYKTYLKEKFNV